MAVPRGTRFDIEHDAVFPGQPYQPLTGAVEQLGIGRERHVLGLDRGIDRESRKVARLGRAGPCRDREALLDQRYQPLVASEKLFRRRA